MAVSVECVFLKEQLTGYRMWQRQADTDTRMPEVCPKSSCPWRGYGDSFKSVGLILS